MCSFPQPTNDASGTKVVSLAPALNIFHPGYGEDFLLETQDRLTVCFVGVSVSLPSTPSGPLLITILTV